MIDSLNSYRLPDKVYPARNNVISFNFKGKIPEHVYHLTSKDSWNKIQESEKLIPYKDGLSDLYGVFTFDMKDFLNNWTSSKPVNFAYGLLRLIRYRFDDFVLLRIKLNKSILPDVLVRSETELFKKDSKALKGLPVSEAVKDPKYDKQVEYVLTREIPLKDIECVNQVSDNVLNDILIENSSKYRDDAEYKKNSVLDFMNILIGNK